MRILQGQNNIDLTKGSTQITQPTLDTETEAKAWADDRMVKGNNVKNLMAENDF